MSKTFGQRIVERFFFKYQVKLQAQLDRMGNQVVVSLIFLRMFPMTPNWAVNIICGASTTTLGLRPLQRALHVRSCGCPSIDTKSRQSIC